MSRIRFLADWHVFTHLLWVALGGLAAAGEEILVNDFEAEDYGAWQAAGSAFGTGPARGTLGGQMKVSGFLGKGLVNSFLGGDRPTGRLTSPAFTIERDYLKFLIGGGGHEGKTCMNLLVGGKVVRSACGPNTEPGGSEALDWENWDIREWKGQRAVLEIVDEASGGWGHINVDQIVQGDTPAAKLSVLPSERNEAVPRPDDAVELKIGGKYLLVPVSNKGRKGELTVVVDGCLVHRLECDFPRGRGEVDWWGWLDLSEYVGKTARVAAGAPPEVRALISTAERIPHLQPLYDEALRPQFHMSQMRGWNNDPNGMVWHDGKYHFFWQCNPAGREWGNMYWGHATSPDMVHWTEQAHALRPFGGGAAARHPSMADKNCFSGSGNIDADDTAGWQRGAEKTMVLAFTDTGCGEALAYSVDGGRSWRYHEGNPVIRHEGRDPKLVWYAPGRHWVLAVYDRRAPFGDNIAIYTSRDLKRWEYASSIPGYFECPELFELPVEGEPGHRKWVVFAADARYATGEFDGGEFKPDEAGKRQLHWGPYYASQCFSNPPDGRVVQIGWARIAMPEMPFNQTFGVPLRLSLRRTADGLRMFGNPVVELERLRKPGARTFREVALTPEAPSLQVEAAGQLFDIVATLRRGSAKRAVLRFGGTAASYDFAAAKLDEMPLGLEGDRLQLRVLVDRPMFELVGGGGACVKTGARRDMGKPLGAIALEAEGGALVVESLEVHEMSPAWPQP